MTPSSLPRVERSKRAHFSALIGLSILLLGAPAAAQRRGGATRATPDTTVIRTYDITDLIAGVRDYPFESDVVPPTEILMPQPDRYASSPRRGGGQGLFDKAATYNEDKQPPTDSDLAQETIDLIQESIEPDSWRANGGLTGTIREFNRRLIVRNTSAVHAEITALLADLRRSAGTVTVRAYWARLDDRQVESFRSARTDKREALARLAESNQGLIVHQAETTCFNGQTVHLASGRARSYIVNTTVVTGTGAAGYQPDMKYLHIGALLQIKPIVNDDTDTAVVDLVSIVSRDESDLAGSDSQVKAIKVQAFSLGANLRSAGAQPLAYIGNIDRLNIPLQHFRTTARIPLATPVLIGGMTMPGDADEMPLYIIIEIGTNE